MNVRTLISILSKYNQDLDVVIQEDSEGNGFHKAYAVGEAWDDPDNDYPSIDGSGHEYDNEHKRVLVIV
jgi:hypothetical protein